jgi:hypothetical protein
MIQFDSTREMNCQSVSGSRPLFQQFHVFLDCQILYGGKTTRRIHWLAQSTSRKHAFV